MKTLLLSCALLAGLGAGAAMAQQPAAIEGWGKLKFGMSIDEAVKATPEIPWEDVEACKSRHQKPEVGLDPWCTLSTAYSGPYSITIAGVEFFPTLTFDQHGQLTRITLSTTYAHLTSVNERECRDGINRVEDGVSGRFGPLQSGSDGSTKATDAAAYQEWFAELLLQAKLKSEAREAKEAAKPLGSPPRSPRSFVAVGGSAQADYCIIDVHYVSATQLRKDTGAF